MTTRRMKEAPRDKPEWLRGMDNGVPPGKRGKSKAGKGSVMGVGESKKKKKRGMY